MSTEKKQYKCGECGEVGHNKKTCPKNKETVVVSNDSTPVLDKVVVITLLETITYPRQQTTIICASRDAATRKIAQMIQFQMADFAEEDEDHPNEPLEESFQKIAFYTTQQESWKHVPIPTLEDIEKVLDNKKNHNGLLIKIGEDLENPTLYAWELRIREQTLCK
jgi:hypothetical protein